jgi:hypothetical protein
VLLSRVLVGLGELMLIAYIDEEVPVVTPRLFLVPGKTQQPPKKKHRQQTKTNKKQQKTNNKQQTTKNHHFI